MLKIKTAELTGQALDWAVARLECGRTFDLAHFTQQHNLGNMKFSTDWAHGGPLIEREQVSILVSFLGSHSEGANAKPSGWCARKYQYGVLTEPLFYGKTPLIAAMRCFVALNLGDVVEVPEELFNI